MRREWKGLARFVLLFAIVYTILLVPWPGFGKAYAAFYRGFATTLFGGFRDTVVRLVPEDSAEADTHLTMQPVRSLRVANQRLSSRKEGWLSTAFIVALVLASPVPRRRRLRALGWALVGVHLFIAARLAFLLLTLYNPLVTPGASAPGWVVLGRHLTMSEFAVPCLLWILVTFRAEDWRELRAKGSSSALEDSRERRYQK